MEGNNECLQIVILHIHMKYRLVFLVLHIHDGTCEINVTNKHSDTQRIKCCVGVKHNDIVTLLVMLDGNNESEIRNTK